MCIRDSYQSPVLTDYNFSIYASEICPGSYEDIYITTSRNCNATAEINTELDSITLTIETGKEFVSFYKNDQKKDTVIFMFNELGSIYLRQDSTYIGSTPLDINIKSDWAGIIKYQQLVINPQEQFQIRVPDQPRIVYSGGVGALMIEPYSTSICPPYISENLRYTALIKKGGNRGLLYDYDTGNSGDTLTNLTPQEDGEKYFDFITEGEILNEADTVLIKIFSNNENIDTTEAVIFIYPNDIDVQIIPSVISQGDTARVVLKKRGVNGLEDFAPDKLFNVEIVQGLEYGLILDSLSNDTLTIFSNIPQGFKIIAKDSTGIDSTRIRIKVSTEESGFPVAGMIRNNTKQNEKEIVDDNKNQKNDDEIITPDWIIPGPILLEGFGDVVVGNECEDFPCDQRFVYSPPSIVSKLDDIIWSNTFTNEHGTKVFSGQKGGETFILFDDKFYVNQYPIKDELIQTFQIEPCFKNNNWQFLITTAGENNEIKLKVYVALYDWGYPNDIDNINELNIIPENENCLALKDFEKHRPYYHNENYIGYVPPPGIEKYYIKEMAINHEKVHVKFFQLDIKDALKIKTKHYGVLKSFREHLKFIPNCTSIFNNKNNARYQATKYYNLLLKEFVKQLKIVNRSRFPDDRTKENKTQWNDDVQITIDYYQRELRAYWKNQGKPIRNCDLNEFDWSDYTQYKNKF